MELTLKQAVPIVKRGGDYIVKLAFSTGDGQGFTAVPRIGLRLLGAKGSEYHEVRAALDGKILFVELFAMGGWQLYAGGFAIVITMSTLRWDYSFDVIPPVED